MFLTLVEFRQRLFQTLNFLKQERVPFPRPVQVPAFPHHLQPERGLKGGSNAEVADRAFGALGGLVES